MSCGEHMVTDELHDDGIARRKVEISLHTDVAKPQSWSYTSNPNKAPFLFCHVTLYKYTDSKYRRSLVETLCTGKDGECGDLGMRHDIGQLISHIPSAAKPCKPEVVRPKWRKCDVLEGRASIGWFQEKVALNY